MGRDMSSGEHVVAYGVTIKLPPSPNFAIMEFRLKNFGHDTSLFAAASRTIGKEVLEEAEDAGLPDQIAKSAKLAAPPILISFGRDANDLMTEEEKKILEDNENMRDSEHLYGMNRIADGAIEQILGSDHGFVLYAYTARSGYEEDDGELDPVLFLFTNECSSDKQYEAKVKSYDLDIPPMSLEEKAETDGKIDQILRAFSLEAEGPPGWKLIASNTCSPR